MLGFALGSASTVGESLVSSPSCSNIEDKLAERFLDAAGLTSSSRCCLFRSGSPHFSTRERTINVAEIRDLRGGEVQKRASECVRTRTAPCTGSNDGVLCRAPSTFLVHAATTNLRPNIGAVSPATRPLLFCGRREAVVRPTCCLHHR